MRIFFGRNVLKMLWQSETMLLLADRANMSSISLPQATVIRIAVTAANVTIILPTQNIAAKYTTNASVLPYAESIA